MKIEMSNKLNTNNNATTKEKNKLQLNVETVTISQSIFKTKRKWEQQTTFYAAR